MEDQERRAGIVRRYFIQFDTTEETEVPVEIFVQYERMCDFFNESRPTSPATGGFGGVINDSVTDASRSVLGRIELDFLNDDS